MKKVLSTVLAFGMALSVLTGCGGSNVATKETKKETTSVTETQAEDVKETAVKTGLSMIADVAKSKDAAEDAEGMAQTNIALVAVTVDDAGVIDNCVIDAIQVKIGFNAAGELTTDIAATFASKNELGDDYGMRKASSIGAEWNEQAAAFAAYVTGKTFAEVAGIAVDESGKATDADLVAAVTLALGDFQNLVAKAAK